MIRVALFSFWIGALATSASAADTGAAATRMLNRQDASKANLDISANVQRVRIPVLLQAWNNVPLRTAQGTSAQKQPKIAAKPLNHILRARIERSNDFYLGDWRIQTTPIRWLKTTNQYQVRLEVFRRYGESGQVEESLGTLNLSGVLQKQSDGLFIVQGSTRRKFHDSQGQPVLEIQAGIPQNQQDRAPLVSKSAVDDRL